MFLECTEENQISPEDLVFIRSTFIAIGRSAAVGFMLTGVNYMLCYPVLENCAASSYKLGFTVFTLIGSPSLGFAFAGANYMLCHSALETCAASCCKFGFTVAFVSLASSLIKSCFARNTLDTMFENRAPEGRSTAAA